MQLWYWTDCRRRTRSRLRRAEDKDHEHGENQKGEFGGLDGKGHGRLDSVYEVAGDEDERKKMCVCGPGVGGVRNASTFI